MPVQCLSGLPEGPPVENMNFENMTAQTRPDRHQMGMVYRTPEASTRELPRSSWCLVQKEDFITSIYCEIKETY